MLTNFQRDLRDIRNLTTRIVHSLRDSVENSNMNKKFKCLKEIRLSQKS